MKSSSFWIILLTGILILEGALIVLNNPELNLIGGIILLGILLFGLGRRFSSGDISGKKRNERQKTGASAQKTVPGAPAGASDTAAGTPSRKLPDTVRPRAPGRELFPTFSAWGRKARWIIPSRNRGAAKAGVGTQGTPVPKDAGSRPDRVNGKPEKKRKFWRREKAQPHNGTPGPAREPAGMPPAPSRERKRFETFTAMGSGIRVLFSSFSRRKKETGAPAPQDRVPLPDDSESPSSLASLNVDAASPVSIKRDPSPFSPLVQDMDLDPELILSRQDPGTGSSSDILYSDADLDALETAAFDQDIAKLDLSLDEDTAITIDDTEEDEVAQILDAYHDELVAPDAGSEEISLDDELAGLENLELDFPEMDPDAGGEAQPVKQPGSGVKGVTAPLTDPGSPRRPGAQPSPPVPGSRTASSPSPPVRMPEKAQEESMLSFAAASAGDDDLISSLRSDMKSTKRQVDQSLVRDLKDVRVQIGDIEKDLSDFEKDLAAFIAKRNK